MIIKLNNNRSIRFSQINNTLIFLNGGSWDHPVNPSYISYENNRHYVAWYKMTKCHRDNKPARVTDSFVEFWKNGALVK